jgi:uncharacterized membrane protein YhaH (DUF805 family)
MPLIALWFGSRPVTRLAYAASGFGLMALKYVSEALVVHQVTGRWFSPLDYLNPLLTARQAALGGNDWLLAAMAVWTLPFLWIGVSMTWRRLEDAGFSPLLVALYFVPLVNYLLMLTLCGLPSRPRQLEAKPPSVTGGTREGVRSALLGAALGTAIALAMTGASVLVFGAYGTTLFAATPFVMGAASAFVYNAHARRAMGTTLLVATAAVVLAGAAILLFALEGVLCLAMAAPLAVVLALMGAVAGRALALRSTTPSPGLAALVLPLPLIAGLQGAPPPRFEPRVVLTALQIDAPPEAVWPHVVAFSTVPEPPAWFFRLGIAYPQRARIAGRGAGAVRRCEFSTGAFIEPITVWEEPRRLAFDVVQQPPPMTEWSPYRHVSAPHLDGYLVVRRGEFRLLALPGGRTRLEGRTFYEMKIAPAAYWSLWSDAVIHAIHERVLAHIKARAEG